MIWYSTFSAQAKAQADAKTANDEFDVEHNDGDVEISDFTGAKSAADAITAKHWNSYIENCIMKHREENFVRNFFTKSVSYRIY